MLDAVLKFSIDRRWLIVLLTVLAAVVGGRAILRLPIDAVPDITNNQVQVNTTAAALSPTEVEKQVTFPVETALAGIPGLEYTRSLSRNGFSQVTAVFEDAADVYFARQQVAERLRTIDLPGDARPEMGNVTTGLGEVYMYTVEYDHEAFKDGAYVTPEGERLATDVEKAEYLRTVQDYVIAPQLRTVRNVAGVDTIGGYEKQYVVQPDPMRLAAYGLTLADVIAALERNNASTGAGVVEHKGTAVNVRAAGRITTAAELADVAVASPGGVALRVGDLAEVVVGGAPRTGSASENGQEVVIGTAQMLIGANSRTVALAVHEKMAEIAKSLPPGVRAKTVLDRTELVNATVHTVVKNLLEGAVLVIAVLLLMLGNVRAALICALAIPLSMLLTAIGMTGAGISGNLMSLGAIDFGIIVDGAVIIVENCLRHLAERQHALGRTLTRAERLETVLAATRQMVRPSVYGQAIIVTVYLPVLALTGTEGKLFTPMAATVLFALVAAFVLSLTLVPALVALSITGRVNERENVVVRGLKRGYGPLLGLALRGRWPVIAAAAVTLAGAAFLFTRIGQEFVPTLDEKNLAVQAVRMEGTGVTQSQAMQFQVERALSAFPEVAFVFSKTGTSEVASDPMGPNISDTFIMLKPEADWRDEDELDARIEDREKQLAAAGIGEEEHEGHGGHDDKDDHDEHAAAVPVAGHKGKLLRLMELTLRGVPGNNYEFTQPIQMRFNELLAGVRGDVAVKVFGDEFEQMVPTAERVAAVLRDTPGAADVRVEQTQGLPTLTVTPDRAALARYGLSVADVQDVVAAAVGGRNAGEVFQGDRRFNVVVRLADATRERIDTLTELPVPLPAAQAGGVRAVADEPARPPFVPLGSVAAIELAEGPSQVSRENGKRRVVVQANVRGRDLGSFVADAQARIDREIKPPPGGWLGWGGQFENLQSAKGRLRIVVPACFGLILLLLLSAFGNVRDAAMVFACVPLALVGGVLALWLRDIPLSISAVVGFIALSGVAVLNGLVMVSTINALHAEGRPWPEAISAGSLTRLRPVLMTALVAGLGFVPMALATGTGAEVQRPLATVVIGGIVSATLLTLVVLPALCRVGRREQ